MDKPTTAVIETISYNVYCHVIQFQVSDVKYIDNRDGYVLYLIQCMKYMHTMHLLYMSYL